MNEAYLFQLYSDLGQHLQNSGFQVIKGAGSALIIGQVADNPP
jgi:hypothetical protein